MYFVNIIHSLYQVNCVVQTKFLKHFTLVIEVFSVVQYFWMDSIRICSQFIGQILVEKIDCIL